MGEILNKYLSNIFFLTNITIIPLNTATANNIICPFKE